MIDLQAEGAQRGEAARRRSAGFIPAGHRELAFVNRRVPGIAAAVVVALGTGVAWGAPPAEIEEETADTTSVSEDLFEVAPRARSADGPLSESAIAPAKAYAEAKRALARGQATAALKALAKSTDSLIEDREALLKGDALLALGDNKGAKIAYQRAFDKAELRLVRIAAARGLVAVFGQLGEPEQQLVYLDALLAEQRLGRRADLLFQRAVVLHKLGRFEEASRVAWQLMLDFPAARVTAEAEKLLDKLVKQGIQKPDKSARLELARASNLWRSGEHTKAAQALDALEESAPELRRRIALERAAMFKARGKKAEEMEVLERLYTEGLDEKVGPQVLERLGQLAMNRGDNKKASDFFDEMASLYPRSPRTADVQYLSSWLPYRDGDYVTAVDRFLNFAKNFGRSKKRPEALWFAGWSAFLGQRDALSRRAFEQLLEEHPASEMTLFARYWMGRIKERSNEIDSAKEWYREVLKGSPIGYHGHWAATRLEKLGERVVITAPPEERQATVGEVLALLGPKRPLGVDRAISLHKAGLEGDALEELEAVSAQLARVRDTRGRVMIAEMLAGLGAHHQAYRLASAIIPDGADLITGKPYAWRAWRLAYPKAFEEEVKNASEAHGVDPLLILAIMRTESSFRPTVASPVGARGLMQLMPNTARLIGRTDKAARPHAARYRTPKSNVWLGGWYLKSLLERYGGQVALAAGAYNAGPAAMDRWVAENANRGNQDLDVFIESIPYKETRQYVRRVLESYLVYRRLDASSDVSLALAVENVTPPPGAVAF